MECSYGCVTCTPDKWGHDDACCRGNICQSRNDPLAKLLEQRRRDRWWEEDFLQYDEAYYKTTQARWTPPPPPIVEKPDPRIVKKEVRVEYEKADPTSGVNATQEASTRREA